MFGLVGVSAGTFYLRSESTVVWRFDAGTLAVKSVSRPSLPKGIIGRDQIAAADGTLVLLNQTVEGASVRGFRGSQTVWESKLSSAATEAQKAECEGIFSTVRASRKALLVQVRSCDTNKVRTMALAASDGKVLWERLDVAYDVTLPARRLGVTDDEFVVGVQKGSATSIALIDSQTGATRREVTIPMIGSYWVLRTDGRYAVVGFPDDDANIVVDFSLDPPSVKTLGALNRAKVDVFNGVLYEAEPVGGTDPAKRGYRLRATNLATSTVQWTSSVNIGSGFGTLVEVDNITATKDAVLVAFVNGSVRRHRVSNGQVETVFSPLDSSDTLLTEPVVTRSGGILGDVVSGSSRTVQLRARLTTYDRATDTIVSVEQKVPRWRVLLKRPNLRTPKVLSGS